MQCNLGRPEAIALAIFGVASCKTNRLLQYLHVLFALLTIESVLRFSRDMKIQFTAIRNFLQTIYR